MKEAYWYVIPFRILTDISFEGDINFKSGRTQYSYFFRCALWRLPTRALDSETKLFFLHFLQSKNQKEKQSLWWQNPLCPHISLPQLSSRKQKYARTFPFCTFFKQYSTYIRVEERTSITRQNILLTTKIFRSACMLSAHSKYQKIQGLLLCRKLSSLCFKLHVAMKIVLPNHQIPFLFLASY